ncbi:subtilisin-like protein, partial [Myriangium duriaei CBS 260.36]
MSVISISCSGESSQAINKAIDEAYHQGVITVVPAGDKNRDAKQMSPSASLHAITVGATDRNKIRTSWSNWGSRVNIFAPGVRICSAWKGNDNKAIKSASGSAAAAAHVAGIVVHLKSFNHLRTAETTWNFMQSISPRGVVKNEKRGSNMFAYNFSG